MTDATKTFHLTLPASLSLPESENDIESSGAIVIIGANGSGKTRLGSWIEFSSEHKHRVHRVSAQKSLSMPPSASPSTMELAEAELLYGHAQGSTNIDHYKSRMRWGQHPNTFLLNDYEKLMVYLFSEEFDKSTKYRQEAKAAGQKKEPPETKLDVVKRIWERTLLYRELFISGGKVEANVRRASSPS